MSHLVVTLKIDYYYYYYYDILTLFLSYGEAGGWGNLFPRWKPVLSFSWGLGIESNNMAEALALWQGLKLAKNQGLKDIVVIKDSRLVIQTLNASNLPEDVKIRQMVKKIHSLRLSFQNLDAFHVLRKNNVRADLTANAASSLAQGILDLNGSISWSPIP